MIKALALIAFVLSLTAIACRGQVEVLEVPVTVTPLPAATQETPADTANPTATPTWQEWLGQQIATGSCPNPNGVISYRNERRSPPYHADFYCRAPTPTPDAVATQVAATVAAIPTPTRRPMANPRPTRRPTATPRPTPTFNEWLNREISTLQCDDPRDELTWENAKRKWPYKADFWCMSPTPDPTEQLREQASQPQGKKDITRELIRCGTSLEAITGMVMSGGLDFSGIALCMAPHLLGALSEMFPLDSILVDDGGTNPHLRAEFDHTVVVPAGGERRVNGDAKGYGYLNYKFVSVKDTYSKELLELRFRVYSNGERLRSTVTAGESGSFVVHEGETLTLEFDNSNSLITGKRVWFSWHWSESPDYKYRYE